MAGPWSAGYVDGEQREELDVTGLSDTELENLYQYRSTVLAFTPEGFPDRAVAIWRHAIVWQEIERRQAG